MTTTACERCMICGGPSLEPLISIPDVPALCNRLCRSEAEAANAPRGEINLSYCMHCGHIFNSAFDQQQVDYDVRFENTLTFSPRYRQYAEITADRVINRYGLRGKRIVEIGCGNGDFLRLLCGAGNHGEGYDPSQSTSRLEAGRGSVEIIGRNFAAEDACGADFVCCRHVLEHLPEPMGLLRQLRESMAIKAYAVKAGPWLFLTGHEAYDWRTGMVDEAVSGPSGYPLFGHHHKSRREADFIFNQMRRVLAEFGTDFAHSVRLDQYYPTPRAVAALRQRLRQ